MKLLIDFASERDKRKLFEILKSRKPVPYEISIKQHRPVRSISDNRYYFGVCLEILSQELGYDKDDLHEILAMKFLPPREIVLPTSEIVLVRSSTADLDDAQFKKYLEDVRRFALSELDTYIPLKGEFLEV